MCAPHSPNHPYPGMLLRAEAAEAPRRRERTATPELIAAVENKLLNFNFEWDDIDGIRRKVNLTPPLLQGLQDMGGLQELAAAITMLSEIDREWMKERTPDVDARVIQRKLDRRDMATLLTGRDSSDWKREMRRLRRELREARRRQARSPRGGRASVLPRPGVFRQEFDHVLRYAEEHWGDIRGCTTQKQQQHVKTIFETANLPDSLGRVGARREAWTGSPTGTPRGFAVRFLAGAYGLTKDYVNRVLRKA